MLRQFFCAASLRLRAFAWLGLLVFIGHQFFRAYLKYAVNEFYGRRARLRHVRRTLLLVLQALLRTQVLRPTPAIC